MIAAHCRRYMERTRGRIHRTRASCPRHLPGGTPCTSPNHQRRKNRQSPPQPRHLHTALGSPPATRRRRQHGHRHRCRRRTLASSPPRSHAVPSGSTVGHSSACGTASRSLPWCDGPRSEKSILDSPLCKPIARDKAPPAPQRSRLD